MSATIGGAVGKFFKAISSPNHLIEGFLQAYLKDYGITEVSNLKLRKDGIDATLKLEGNATPLHVFADLAMSGDNITITRLSASQAWAEKAAGKLVVGKEFPVGDTLGKTLRYYFGPNRA